MPNLKDATTRKGASEKSKSDFRMVLWGGKKYLSNKSGGGETKRIGNDLAAKEGGVLLGGGCLYEERQMAKGGPKLTYAWGDEERA